jgi:hypothetical protein
MVVLGCSRHESLQRIGARAVPSAEGIDGGYPGSVVSVKQG